MSQKLKKVVWAFDPYTDIRATWDRCKETVQALKQGDGVVVEPVYVMGSEQLDWVGHLEAPQLDHIKPYVEKAMQSRLVQLDMDLAPPVILMSEANSRSGDIQTLLNHVENVDADLILINTHAREGVERFFMGSFAETLGLRSTVPVLFVSPNCAPIKSLDKIVYPTNFSSSSFTIYKHFLQQYAGIVKEVVIHNKIMRPINAFAESSLTAMGGSWIAPQEYIDKENKRREEIGQEWSQSATELSVKASVNVDSDLGDVSESIEKATRETGADMVVVGSFASALETAIIGSIARQVVRQGHVPTLVVHKPS